MNILILISELPYPKYKNGTASTIYNLILEWRKKYIVDILYFSEKDELAYNFFKSQNIGISQHNLKKNKTEYYARLGSKITLKSRNVWNVNYDANKFKIDGNGYDIIMLVGFESVFLYDSIININTNTKLIFFELDCLSLLYDRYYKSTKNIFKKMYYRLQCNIVENIERIIYEKVAKVFFVSEIDKVYCQDSFMKINRFKFDNITNGVEPYTNSKATIESKNIINIGFSGIFDYTPNFQAAIFIIENIIEKLFAQKSDINFHLIGRNPSNRLLRLAQKYKNRLIITGFVDDIDNYIANMDIYISPLFVGTGMKNKILQAMNLGVPLICTSISIEGITQMRHNVNCIVCDSQNGDDWIFHILNLLNDEFKRLSFSSNCKKIIEAQYRWDRIAENMISKCDKIL